MLAPPEHPESSVARTNNSPTHSPRHRIFAMTAAIGALAMSSMHRPEHASDIVDTKIVLSSLNPDEPSNLHEDSRRRTDATEEQMAQLDHEIDECYALMDWKVLGQLSLFALQYKNPTPEDFKILKDSMPTAMQPRIIRIAKLLSLHPAEGMRIEASVSEKTGVQIRRQCSTNHSMIPEDKQTMNVQELRCIRHACREFLEACNEVDEEFESALAEVQKAELEAAEYREQFADLGK